MRRCVGFGTMENSTACPCEGDIPDGAPGSVDDHEILLRGVPLYEQLVFTEEGKPTLGPTFFSQDELQGKSGKTVSILRDDLTPAVEVSRRCTALNKDELWQSDPVVARALTEALRRMVNSDNQREICVNADPTTNDNDKLGACATHASIIRAIAESSKSVPPRLTWGVLRANLAARFSDLKHLSGKAPTPRPSPTPSC
jgi:hypothetical protein